MSANAILQMLQEQKHYMYDNFDVKKIGLFGSYAKGNETSESDIDIIVDMPSSFDKYYALKEFLESLFHKKVDLGLEKSIRELVKHKIANEIIYVK